MKRLPEAFVLLLMLTATIVARASDLMLADFEHGVDDWSVEVNSGLEATSEKASHGKWSLKWTLHSDGANAYGNSLVLAVKQKDWSNYRALKLDFLPAGKVSGRIGCQLTVGTNTLTLADVHPQVVQGEWKTVELQLPAEDLRNVRELRFFCNALDYPQGDHVFFLDHVRLVAKEKPRAEFRRGTPMPGFSSLKTGQQDAIRKAVAPPPLGKRRNPYSTPMYYPMWGGSSPDGKLREDWQEALVKEWAALGMTKLHFYQYPPGTGTTNRQYTLSADQREGIQMFLRLCRKHDIKIGMRVDLPYTLIHSEKNVEPIGDYWIAHPNNPDNELKAYCGWLAELVALLKGNLEYVIVGDELDWKSEDKEKAWNAELYMKVFTQAAETIHNADPAAKVSMYGASSGRWNEVIGLLQNGYTKYGDAIAINHYDYTVLRGFKADLKKYSPNKKLLLLSNGVGYISSDTTQRNPARDPYSRYNDLDQAAMIARTMYTWWDVDADVAPYYICLRGYTYKGKYHPWWYGFFGFMDLNIDENDQASVKRYPGWYAYQTVATVFHDRDAFREPTFAVESDSQVEYLKAHERKGKELLIMAWGKGTTNIRIGSTQYGHPVRVSLLDRDQWSDVSATKDAGGITLHDVPLSLAPTILRLVSL